MLSKIIFSVLIITNIITASFCFRLQDRLVKIGQQLEHYRVELSAATDREQDIAESIRRTGEILDSSVTTLSGIRAQIAAIRESYEEMENRLYNTRRDNTISNNTTNYTDEELK